MKTFITAEIGLNHNGDLNTAQKLIRVAADAGVDAVKFQTYWNIPKYRHLNFTKCQWSILFYYCEMYQVKWFSTPFDLEAIRFLDCMGMDTWKLPSNKIVLKSNILLNAIQNARSRKHTIISTGISAFVAIQRLIEMFNDNPITLLHCVSKYPCPIEDLNLDRIVDLKSRFHVPVGLSDHSTSWAHSAVTAIEKGATMIEKHITLDQKAKGPDHAASIEPKQLKKMVDRIREHERN